MRNLLAIVSIALMTVLASCAGNAQTRVRTERVAAFKKAMTAKPGSQLVDVRSAEEYAAGHIRGALNIDVNGDGFEAKVAQLDKTRPVLVYCRSGRRSAMAASKLEEMGFKEIHNLDGGIGAWQDGGEPVE